MPLSFLILFTFSAFLFSVLGTGGALLLLKQTGVMDVPEARSNHTKPTPRGAGIAVIGAILMMLIASAADKGIVLGCLILAVISFIDDKRGVAPQIRLIAHLLAIALAIGNVHGVLFQGLLPFYLDQILLMGVWLWVINLTNFMDGIDGITGAETLAITLGMIALVISVPAAPEVLLVDSMIIGAAALGFLLWNWHPARIFLGDVGSIPLGFLLGYLLLNLAGAGFWEAALILPAYYLTDASVTLLKRLSQGKKIWEAHSEHAYQVAVKSGLSHNNVVEKITALNLVLIVLAVASAMHKAWALPALTVAYALTFALFFMLRARKGHTA